MRVIAGSARGRRLRAPKGHGTRPITDRAKEAIFNMVRFQIPIDGATVVDLFAGSGSFGIECLSRGAERSVFVERNRGAAATIAANLEELGFADRAEIMVRPVERVVDRLDHADLAFCDPPYADDPWARLLPRIRADLLVGHAETPVELVPPWAAVRRRTYGRSEIVIAARAPRETASLGDPAPEGDGA
ncbi:MAG: RsmD family RNA methyltransferase [Acidimicrobiales bacterium]